MLFDCPHCSTRYDESRKTLGEYRFRVKCARCHKVFVAKAPASPVAFEDETQADSDHVDFDDLTVADGSAGPVRFDEDDEVDFDDHTTIDQPTDMPDEPATVIKKKSQVDFDDATQMDPMVNAPASGPEPPGPPVEEFSDLPDLSTGMGIFDDRINPGAASTKAAPGKPPDTVIPELDSDLFTDETRHAAPSRDLLEKALPDLIDVDRGDSEQEPE